MQWGIKGNTAKQSTAILGGTIFSYDTGDDQGCVASTPVTGHTSGEYK
jgi:hypothetical protein